MIYVTHQWLVLETLCLGVLPTNILFVQEHIFTRLDRIFVILVRGTHILRVCLLREHRYYFGNLCSTEEHLIILSYNSHYVFFQLLCQSRLGFHNQSRILISFNTFICMGLSLTVIILVLRTNVIDNAAACLQN